MLDKMLGIFGSKGKGLPKEINDFMAERQIVFNGYGGLNVNRQVVSEFGHLVRMLTEGELDTLSDFRAVYDSRELFRESIKVELARDVLRESQAFGYSRQITEGNMTRLRGIVESIIEYVELCDRHQIDIDAARQLEK